jgi:hypothetical protein
MIVAFARNYGNQRFDIKGAGQEVKPSSPRVPMQGVGTELFVVVMKSL